MKLKEKTLQRIIENERVVTQLESIYNSMRQDLGGCKNYHIKPEECKRWGIDYGSLIAAILDCYLKIKEN
jgi:hypothetical protein